MHALSTELRRQASGGRDASPNGKALENPGAAVHRKHPDHEIKAGQPAELGLQVTSG